MEDKKIFIRFKTADYKKLKARAKKERLPVSSMIKHILFIDDYIKQEKPKQVEKNEDPQIEHDWIQCNKCLETFHSKNGKIEKIPLAHGGMHIKLSCPTCGGFIKFLAYEESRLYCGKYAGKSIKEIYREDPQYLDWALHNLRISDRARKNIEEVLSR